MMTWLSSLQLLSIMNIFKDHHSEHPSTTVPLYFCGDISHGLADQGRKVLHGNLELFELEIPYMAEFHFKNTDEFFNATFGFSSEEMKRGIIDLNEIKAMIQRNAEKWPVDDLAGYFEFTSLKLGRDYSDYKLGEILSDSLTALKEVFSLDNLPYTG